MIRRFVAALAATLLLAACSSEPEREWPDPSPALWEVISPEGERGWLFGTIHSLPLEARWRTPALESALANSGVLVVEVADVGDARKAAAVFERYAYDDDLPPLTRRVDAEDRADLAVFLRRAGSAESDFDRTETWAAALQLANSARTDKTGQSVDRALIDVRSEVVALESHALQYGLFDALPPREQADLLMALARDRGNDIGRIEAWLTGDLAALERASAGLLSDPELRAALQTGRNAQWLPRIAGMIEGGRRPFVAVGTAHLFGEQSLVQLLEARGYTVRRLQ